MKRIQEFVGRELQWSQPQAMHRHFDLKCGDETLASLSFRSLMGSFATAVTAERGWTFKRVGFWMPRVTIRLQQDDTEVGVFNNNTWTGGGTLVLADGRQFRANTNFWNTTYEFKTEQEESLVRFTRVRGVFHLASNVEVQPAGAKLAELPLLVTLGWYLAVKIHDDSAGGGAGATAAAAG